MANASVAQSLAMFLVNASLSLTVLNFVESFFCICRDYHMLFIFQFVINNMVYHIDLH